VCVINASCVVDCWVISYLVLLMDGWQVFVLELGRMAGLCACIWNAPQHSTSWQRIGLTATTARGGGCWTLAAGLPI